jgi:hypothetical protein
MLAALMSGLAIIAADPSPPAPAAPTAPKPTATTTPPDSTRLVCKKETAPNSRLTQRVCMTAAEWEQRTEASRAAVQEIQNRPRTN